MLTYPENIQGCPKKVQPQMPVFHNTCWVLSRWLSNVKMGHEPGNKENLNKFFKALISKAIFS